MPSGPVLGKAYVEVLPDTKSFGRELQSSLKSAVPADIGAGLLRKQFADMGDAGADVATKTKSGFLDIAGAIGTVGEAIGGIVQVAQGVAQVVGKVAEFASASIQLAVDAEEAGSKFETVFGTASTSLNAFVEDFAHGAGLTEAELQNLLGTTGNVVKALGATEQEAAAFSKSAATLAGDLASFNNTAGGSEEVLGSIQAAITGEYESLKSLGVVINATEVAERALQDTGKKRVEQLTRLEKAEATMALIYERSGDAVGDLGRTSGSAANQQRELQASIKEIQTDLGERLLPMWMEVLEAVKQNLPAIQDLAGGVASFAEHTLPTLVDGLVKAADALSVLLGVSRVTAESIAAGGKWEDANQLIVDLVGHYGDLNEGVVRWIDVQSRAVEAGNESGEGLALTTQTLERMHEQLKLTDEEWFQFLNIMHDNKKALGLVWSETMVVDQALGALQKSIGSANEDARDFVGTQIALGNTALSAAEGMDAGASASQRAAAAIRDQRDALRELSDAYLAQISPVFAAQQAETEFNEALAATKEGGKATGEELDALNEATARRVAADLEVVALGDEVIETFESNRRAMKGYGAESDTATDATQRLHDKRKEINDQEVIARINVGEIDGANDKAKGLEDNLKRIHAMETVARVDIHYTTSGEVARATGVGANPNIGTPVAGFQIQGGTAGLVSGGGGDNTFTIPVAGGGGVAVNNQFFGPVGGDMAEFANQIMAQGAIELRLLRA